MTPTIYHYIPELNVLRQKATMEKPVWTGKTYMGFPYIESEFRWQIFQDSLKAYDQYLADLRTIQVAPGDWKPDKEYVEGRDFSITKAWVKGKSDEEFDLAVLLPPSEPNSTLKNRITEILAGGIYFVPQTGGFAVHKALSELEQLVIQIAMEAWRAGENWAFEYNDPLTDVVHEPDKKQYFKDKFNHDI